MTHGAWFPDLGLAFAPALIRWDEESLGCLARNPPLVRTAEWTDCFVVLKPGHPDPLGPEEFAPFGELLGPEAGRFNLRNFVGLSRFRGVSIEVVNRKIRPGQFRAMFDEVCRGIPEVVFSFATPAGFAWEKGDQPAGSMAYPALLYLLRIFFGEALTVEALYRLVHRNPHRRLEAEPRVVPVEDAGPPGPATAMAVAAAPERLARLPPGHPLAATDLARRLCVGGVPHFPRQVREARPRWTFDTPENRFLKHFFSELRTLVGTFRQAFSEPRSLLNGDLGPLLDRAGGLLESICADRFFEDVGVLRAIPWSSTVLTRRDGYRQLFRYFVELHTASRVQWNPADLRSICEVRDVPTVYEYWVLLRLLAAFRARWGAPISAEPLAVTNPHETRVNEGLRVRYGSGAEFRFQASMQAYSGGDLRPDFVISVGEKRLVLDAKYRKRGGDGELYGAEDEPFGTGEVKQEDLLKMHAYRDALPSVVGAFAVYPGRESRVSEHPETGVKVGALALCPAAEEGNARAMALLWEQVEWLGACG